MRSLIAASTLCLFCGLPAFADETPVKAPDGSCYELIPGNNTPPFTAILLNKCTGATWLLVREFVPDAKATGSFTFEWHPLKVSEQPEILTMSPQDVAKATNPASESAEAKK